MISIKNVPCPTIDKSRMTCTSLGPESLEITVKAPAGSFFRNSDRHSGAIAGDDGIFVSDFTRLIELLTNAVVSEIISNFDSAPPQHERRLRRPHQRVLSCRGWDHRLWDR